MSFQQSDADTTSPSNIDDETDPFEEAITNHRLPQNPAPNDMSIDLWDECIVTTSAIPSSDQQDYAHDLGLLSVSGENNAAATASQQPASHRPAPNRYGQSRLIRLSVRTIQPMSYKYNANRHMQDAYCFCYKLNKKLGAVYCLCGEDDTDFDWVWDGECKSFATQLQQDNREVHFHKHYSSGTAAIRGSQPLAMGQHYWEIKMISPVYGTDMMVGVGTAEADLNRNSTKFCSFLGSDSDTWGLSYTGAFYHNGKSHCYSPRFGQGSIIGVHLDMWNGTLAFYKNREPLGVACRGLKGKKLYPMVSSTAARSAMKMVCSRSFDSSLQYLCCLALRKMIPSEDGVLDSIAMPPGLKTYLQNNLGWILGPTVPFQCCRVVGKNQNGGAMRCNSPGPARNINTATSTRNSFSGAETANCSLFTVDKNKQCHQDDCGDSDLNISQPSTSTNSKLSKTQSPTLCYRHGNGVSKRRRYVCDKQKLFISLMSLSSSDDSEDEEPSELVAKRKH